MSWPRELEHLRRAARAEQPAPLDVSAAVLRRVAAAPSAPTALLAEPPLLAAAGLAVAAAVVALILAAPWLAAAADPVSQLVQATTGGVFPEGLP